MAVPSSCRDLFPGTTSILARSSSIHRRSVAISLSLDKTVGYSYQLAVVTDDNAMGISQVIRGMDLVPSTPRQILLYRMLGLPVPAFGHVALAVGPDGRRLAKRDGSLKLATLRASRSRSLPTRWLARQLVRLVGINDRDHARKAIDLVRADWACWLIVGRHSAMAPMARVDSDALSEKLMPIGTWAANVSQSVKTSPDQTQAP